MFRRDIPELLAGGPFLQPSPRFPFLVAPLLPFV